ncbi:hypothetical protein SYJ56_18110 [Algoriphagus sp. D3-2-R+10]|uniref:hypothetical protein n=1 Tax=Algoriphagus aurantiacus TaxID=3103948 RepID=UPI002B3F67EF|nr:hypothetical protein [Algoriphagus sp. D3-2-R+10]MEB2777236.1 hypothetical protein [Algoriphagus sp. D3-2-R+10]
MTLQYIHDTEGNTTGVIIPIKEWQSLKAKYSELQEAENPTELTAWQKKIINERLSDYYNNPDNVCDFDKTLDDIERGV